MSLNLHHAMARNRYFAVELAWEARISEICERIFNLKYTPMMEEFTKAVYEWQKDRPGVTPDGIVGPNTWRAMRRVIKNSVRRRIAQAQKKGIIFAPQHNSEGKHDATGAFHIGARQFQRIHHLPEIVYFDNTASPRSRRETIISGIQSATGPLEIIAYFGHGLTNSLSSAKLNKTHIDELTAAIKGNSTKNCVVVLYACSAGAFGGFAWSLAACLNGNVCDIGPVRKVFGHTNSGHSFYNPYVTEFPRDDFFIRPSSDYWRNWRNNLRSTDLWARFPIAARSDVVDELDP